MKLILNKTVFKILYLIIALFLFQSCQKELSNNQNQYGFKGVQLVAPSNGTPCYPFALSNQALYGRIRFSWTRDTAAQQYLLYAIKKQTLDSIKVDSNILVQIATFHTTSADTFKDWDLPFAESYYWCVVPAKLDTNIRYHPSTIWSFFLQENQLPKSPPDPANLISPFDDQVINYVQEPNTVGYDSTQNPINFVFQSTENNISKFQVYDNQNLVCTISDNTPTSLKTCSNALFKLVFDVQQISGSNTGTFNFKITIKSTDTNGNTSISLEKNFFVNYRLN